MLAVPLARQFEHVLNARYLEHEGDGRHAETLDDPATVHAFIEAIPACAARLATYAQDGNRELLGAVDEFLDKAAAGANNELRRVANGEVVRAIIGHATEAMTHDASGNEKLRDVAELAGGATRI